jgi:hypothetical protein
VISLDFHPPQTLTRRPWRLRCGCVAVTGKTAHRFTYHPRMRTWQVLIASVALAIPHLAMGDSAAPEVTNRGQLPGWFAVEIHHESSPTHGGIESLLFAAFTVRSQSAETITITVSSLTARSELEEAELLPVTTIYLSDPDHPIKQTERPRRVNGATFPLRPGQTLDVQVEARQPKAAHLSYHVKYRHEARFSAAGGAVRVRGEALYFRLPNRRN